MKIKNLLVFLSVSVTLASCQKHWVDPEPVPVIPVIAPAPNQPFTVIENFENGTKGGYDAADVTLATGSWNIDGGLLGAEANDVKADKKSVRLRGSQNSATQNGRLSMNFDIKNVQFISIKSSLANFADGQRPNVDPTPLRKGFWELQVSKDGGKTYNKIGETVNPTSTTTLNTTVFYITDTTAARYRIVNTSEFNGASRVRLSIDDITFTGFGNSGVVANTQDTPPNDNANTGSAEAPRGVTIGADAPPATGDNSNILFGNPSNANMVLTDNLLLDQGYYVESYSASRGIPNWVSWHLDETNTTNATKRLDNFAGFTGLPSGAYQVQSNSYVGSGFDRGHNCPSADRTSSTLANSATFLMTNMIPQAPQNNQQTWNNLEQDLRSQTAAGNEVYIVMGNYGRGGSGKNGGTTTTIDNGHVTVPSNVWKVAIIIPKGNSDLVRAGSGGNVKVIAVNTPNVNTISEDWKQYITTVREIETAMGGGFNLFSNLPQSVQDALETQRATGI
ncbi:DNA/RNA non-specific endonuclease [Mucilaginibacter lacusdianchii]|uniref:DNA/RNA non-specific endonuclease n=1 Tax=Mucilaginibacter lacusdianchii TaxID=2684211 RepID=UPI00131BDC21|nr:DNA/RNA non-specific endonuclease [Mucilaginibacter sp. JXJ CY 39]